MFSVLHVYDINILNAILKYKTNFLYPFESKWSLDIVLMR